MHVGYTIQETLCTIHDIHNYFIKKNIKNWSHDTIYTFKNYCTTIFSLFIVHTVLLKFIFFKLKKYTFSQNPLNASTATHYH